MVEPFGGADGGGPAAVLKIHFGFYRLFAGLLPLLPLYWVNFAFRVARATLTLRC